MQQLFPLLSLLLLQEVVGRRKMVAMRKRHESDRDPPECASVKKPCSELAIIECPLECDALDANTEEQEAVQALDKVSFSVLDLTDDTQPEERRKVMRTEGFQRIWPFKCDGRNKFGQPLGISANGFACHEGSDEVSPITSEQWFKTAKKPRQSTVCCARRCVNFAKQPVDYEAGQACEEKSVAEAAQVAALGVTDLEVSGTGQRVAITTVLANSGETRKTGLLATVEVRMTNGVLAFVSGKAKLTEAGNSFLDDLKEPLSALMSMQLTGAKCSYVKIVFCPHGSTTATIDDALDPSLPHDRAEVVGNALSAALPDDVVTLDRKSVV